MNTLNKEFTLGMFFDEEPEKYAELRKRWSEAVNSEKKYTLTLGHHILYLILIGKDWRKSITAPTNKNKLENGYVSDREFLMERSSSPYYKAFLADLSVFKDLISKEAIDKAFEIADFREASDNAYLDSKVS